MVPGFCTSSALFGAQSVVLGFVVRPLALEAGWQGRLGAVPHLGSLLRIPCIWSAYLDTVEIESESLPQKTCNLLGRSRSLGGG